MSLRQILILSKTNSGSIGRDIKYGFGNGFGGLKFQGCGWEKGGGYVSKIGRLAIALYTF